MYALEPLALGPRGPGRALDVAVGLCNEVAGGVISGPFSIVHVGISRRVCIGGERLGG